MRSCRCSNLYPAGTKKPSGQLDVLVSQGQGIADAIRQIGVSEVTHYRWRQEFGGFKTSLFTFPFFTLSLSTVNTGIVIGYVSTLMQIQSAFEQVGIRFLDNDTGVGLEVRLSEQKKVG